MAFHEFRETGMINNRKRIISLATRKRRAVMNLKIMASALVIMGVLASGAGTLYGARANPSVTRHFGALPVTSSSVQATTMNSDGIGWD